jgi:glutathione S-transferase
MALEELKDLGEPVDYEVKSLSFSKNEQKEDWFLKVGCCPLLVSRGDLTDRHYNRSTLMAA